MRSWRRLPRPVRLEGGGSREGSGSTVFQLAKPVAFFWDWCVFFFYLNLVLFFFGRRPWPIWCWILTDAFDAKSLGQEGGFGEHGDHSHLKHRRLWLAQCAQRRISGSARPDEPRLFFFGVETQEIKTANITNITEINETWVYPIYLPPR